MHALSAASASTMRDGYNRWLQDSVRSRLVGEGRRNPASNVTEFGHLGRRRD